MSKTKKKLQDDVLFEEQDIITPEVSSTPLSEDDASLRLLQTQEKLLSNYDKILEKMNLSQELIDSLTDNINKLEKRQDEFIQSIQKNCKVYVELKPASLKKIVDVYSNETLSFKDEIHKCTTAEIIRLKRAYGDIEKNIDVLRLRWWPQGYILILIIVLLFCSNIILIMKVMGKL